MLSKISDIVKGFYEWIKRNWNNIILAAIVMLLVLFSFAAGYIMARAQIKPPIVIDKDK